MDTQILRGLGTSTALLIGLIATSPALAQTTGPQFLGSASNAIDVWIFDCDSPNNDGARARVEDTTVEINLPAFMQVVVGQSGSVAVQKKDVLPGGGQRGEDVPASDFAKVVGGVGLYVVTFKKTAPGPESYEGEVWCVENGALVAPQNLVLHIDQ